MALADAMETLEHTSELDGGVDVLETVAATALPEGPVRDALHGSWLGHRLHPVLVALPIGLNAGVTLLDLLGDEDDRKAATLLQGAAVASAVPAAVTGLADFASIGARGPKRVGLLHALAAAESTLWFGSALAARVTGHHRTAAALTLLGDAAVGAAGYLGGHLAYVNGVGVKAASVGGIDSAYVPHVEH